MARRFETFYRVKTRDNLGDPEYWNRRFEDVDRRVSGNEDALANIDGLSAQVEGLALDRLNLVLAPAFNKINQVAEAGFLLAQSSSSVALTNGATVTFVIDDEAEREVFSPSVFLAITREANLTDYAFAKRVSYSQVTGELVVQLQAVYGNPGPFTDWEISVGVGVSQAVSVMLANTIAARDTAISNATSSSADKTAAQTAKTAAETARTGAETALSSFNTIYLGVRTSPPSSGLIGSFYYDNTDQVFKVLGSSGWAPGHLVSFGGVVSQDYTVTAGGGQSVFTVDGGFTTVDVFKNGTQLNPSGFTLDTVARTVTLTTPAPNGSWVAVRGYKENDASSFYTKSAADVLLDTKFDKVGGTISGPLTLSGGDLKVSSGIVRLNSAGDKYLQWNGAQYSLAGAGNIWHTGNFDPNNKLDKTGGSITGSLAVASTLSASNVTVNGQNAWHAGNFDPNTKFDKTGGGVSGDITVYRSFATNTGSVFLGSGTGRGFSWDGTNYNLLGSGIPWTTGNFDPNTKANLSGSVFTGEIEARPSIWLHQPGVKRARWVVDGGGTLIWQDQGGQNHWFVTNAGQVWTQNYGWMHDYIWNVANERGSAWANGKVINLRTAYAGDWNGTGGVNAGTGVGEPFGPTAALTGFVLQPTLFNGSVLVYNMIGRFRYMQFQISNGAWLNFGAV